MYKMRKTKSTIKVSFENKDFRLIGLPFFNEGITINELRDKFEDAFEEKLMN